LLGLTVCSLINKATYIKLTVLMNYYCNNHVLTIFKNFAFNQFCALLSCCYYLLIFLFSLIDIIKLINYFFKSYFIIAQNIIFIISFDMLPKFFFFMKSNAQPIQNNSKIFANTFQNFLFLSEIFCFEFFSIFIFPSCKSLFHLYKI
jgi:hypothetical protein